MNYYNEIDPRAAAWLQELINEKLIPQGKIDTRSILDVRPDDLRGFIQCHFFAGIGGWPLALQLAGWPDSRPVWTGSAPCQPFSCAGKGLGEADERHLWPTFYGLIKECRPPIIFGEQVASADVIGSQLETAFLDAVQRGDYARANKLANQLVKSPTFGFEHRWLDGICADLESSHYAVGATDVPAASVGAPHIRQRLYWVAHAPSIRQPERILGDKPNQECSPLSEGAERYEGRGRDDSTNGSESGSGLAESQHPERRPINVNREDGRDGTDSGRTETHGEPRTCGEVQRLAGAELRRSEQCDQGQRTVQQFDTDGANGGGGSRLEIAGINVRECTEGEGTRPIEAPGAGAPSQLTGSSNASFWADAIWHACRDGKARRISPQPALFPLANGLPGRVGLLRGAGNAIIPEVAAAFVQAVMESI